MKLNPKAKLKQNWEKLQDTAGNIKEKIEGPVKDKADEWMGIWIHKEIATLFIWDEQVQAWVFGGKMCPNCKKKNRDKFDECQNCGADLEGGEDFKGINQLAHEDMDKAIQESTMLKSYIVMKSQNSRKYEKKLGEVNEKLQGKQEKLKAKFDKLKDKKFLKWLKNE